MSIAVKLARELEGTEQPLHLVGHSFGAQVAIDLALLGPEKLRSLTVLCGRDTPFPSFAAAASSLRVGSGVDVEDALTRWFRPRELRENGDVVRYAGACLRDAEPTQWAAALDAIATYDRSNVVDRITVPVTCVAAAYDPVSSPGAMTELAHRLPRARLHVLEHAAHMSPFLDPAGLASLLQEAADWSEAPRS